MRYLSVFLAAALLLPARAQAGDAAPLTQDSMRQAAESFYSVGLDAARAYAVPSTRLQRDRLSIELGGGTLVLAQPILGRITGACYSGKARLALTPPTPTERASLKARTGSEEFKAEVEALYLRFNDTTAVDLTPGLTPAPDAAALERCSKLFSSRNDVVRKYEESTIGTPFSLEVDLLESLLSPALARDFFLLEAQVEGQGWITYLQRPGRGSEVLLTRLKPLGSFFDPEHWAEYELAPDSQKVTARGRSADILHNQMEVVIPNRSAYTIDALISWKGPVDLRSARFALDNCYGSTWDDPQGKTITVNAVLTQDGATLPYLHRRNELLVALPAVLPAGQTGKVRVKATDEAIVQLTPESYSLPDGAAWFPQEPEYLGGDYTFDWTVKVMRSMSLAGSGTTVREWEEKDKKLNCAQWKSDVPLPFPVLVFGQFKETRGEHKRQSDGKTVAIRLHWMPKVTLDYEMQAKSYEIYREGDRDVESGGPETHYQSVPLSKPPQIVKEVGIIIDYFEQILGPYPNEEVDIAQMAPGLWYGQALPGMVQLTGEYFLSQGLVSSTTDDPGSMDFLKTVLAHEIAHHYWGQVVRWKGTEEQWLSESLAEYSGALYLEASQGAKAFRQQREVWRKMTERWDGRVSVAHANRASGENAGEIRSAMLYNKGPLVIHMLRAQVGNDNFVKILKKVLSDHREQWIDSADFQAAAEAVAGYKLDWFFDQWVRGTGIPELRFSYEVAPAADGKFLFKGRVAQADRANPKALFLPVLFDFGGGQAAPKEWRVKGAEETLQLMLPRRPEKVTIDGAGDLLAKIVYETKS